MIKYKDTILEDYFIDPITAIITNSKGEIQKTYIHNGRPEFKGHGIHQWQVHTHIGYKKAFVIHHLDYNILNNSLENLVYLTRSEHAKIHSETRVFSDETKQKLSEALKGKHHSEKTKRKISKALKGRKLSDETKQKLSEANKNLIWVNNGFISKMVKFEDIPEGFVLGRLK